MRVLITGELLGGQAARTVIIADLACPLLWAGRCFRS
jgi:hypothetical protein